MQTLISFFKNLILDLIWDQFLNNMVAHKDRKFILFNGLPPQQLYG